MTAFRPLRFLLEGSPEVPTKLAEFGAESGDMLKLDMPIDYGQTQKLAQSGALVADFADGPVQYFELNGDVTGWTTANRPPASSVHSYATTIVVSPGAGTRALAFNASWMFQGQIPAQIAAGKTGVLTLLCLGTAATDVVAWWSAEE